MSGRCHVDVMRKSGQKSNNDVLRSRAGRRAGEQSDITLEIAQ